MNLLKNIVDRREALGISQTELARSLGRSPSWINLIESGKRGIFLEDYVKIRGALGMNFNFLHDFIAYDNRRQGNMVESCDPPKTAKQEMIESLEQIKMYIIAKSANE